MRISIKPNPSTFPLNLVPAVALSLLLAAPARPQVLAQRRTEVAPRPAVESRRLRLYVSGLPVGEERYEITREGTSWVMHSEVEYTYWGKVSLRASLRTGADLTPEAFALTGRPFPWIKTDSLLVDVGRDSAVVKEGESVRDVAVPTNFFVSGGTLPASMQMMLVRRWARLGGAGEVQTLPEGRALVDRRGWDTVEVAGRRVRLTRYSLGGITWGRVFVWLDSNQGIVASVMPNHIAYQVHAVREGYEAALPFFHKRAAEDGVAALAPDLRLTEERPRRPVAITGVTLVDGTGAPPVPDATVIVSGDRILAAGPSAQVRVPPGAAQLNARGKTVLPGLWDMHAHLKLVEWGPAYLAAGVTTVRDVGNNKEFVTAMRDAFAAGRGPGPRVLLAGFIDARSAHPRTAAQANTPAEARALVRGYGRAGFEQIKVWGNVRPDILKVVTAEAHRLGMTVTGHVPSGMTAVEAVEAGLDQINHLDAILGVMPQGDFNSPEAQKVIRFFKQRGTVVDPTAVVQEMFWRSKAVPVSDFEPGFRKIPREVAEAVESLGQPPGRGAAGRANLERALALVAALHRAGVPLIAGSDQGVPGHTLHREVELYVRAGLTAMEAIQAATLVPARVMGMDKESGTVEAGKLADLIILDANPLDDIRNIRAVTRVVARGRIYDPAELWRRAGLEP